MVGDRHDLADVPAAQAPAGVDQDGPAYAGSGRDTGQGDHWSGAVPLVKMGSSAGHEDAPLSHILPSARLPATTDGIGVETVLVSRCERGEDAGQIGQGQARLRLTPESATRLNQASIPW